jgi:predicted transcriptional regulator
MDSSQHAPSIDSVADWFLGGSSRRRRLIETLLSQRDDGWTVADLTKEAGTAQATAYEVVRALIDIGLLESAESKYRYRLADGHKLVRPIEDFLKALKAYEEQSVDRPHRKGRRA